VKQFIFNTQCSIATVQTIYENQSIYTNDRNDLSFVSRRKGSS